MMNAQQFFYDHAGFSYNPATETRDQGKIRSASDLARAEAMPPATIGSLPGNPTPMPTLALWTLGTRWPKRTGTRRTTNAKFAFSAIRTETYYRPVVESSTRTRITGG